MTLILRLARFLWCGRRVCAWCKADMGRAPGIPHGKATHGICPECLAWEKAKINLTGGPRCSRPIVEGKPGARLKGLGRAAAGSRS